MSGYYNNGNNKPNSDGTKPKPKRTFHSRVTAGLDLLPSIDGRSTWARIMRDTYLDMISHAGGDDHISPARRLLARRVAAQEAELINLEVRFAACHAEGRDVGIRHLDLYSRLASSQRRILEALGLERTARDVTPSLAEYLADRRAVVEEAACVEDAEIEP